MAVTLQSLLQQCGIQLEPNKLHFAKQYRNCQCVGNFVSAVGATLETLQVSHAEEMERVHKEKAAIAAAASKEASRSASLAERVGKLEKIAIARGLECLPDVTPAARERVMTLESAVA